MQAQRIKTCPTPRMCRVIEKPWKECSVHNLRPEIPDCITGHTPSRVLADNGFTYELVCAHCGDLLD